MQILITEEELAEKIVDAYKAITNEDKDPIEVVCSTHKETIYHDENWGPFSSLTLLTPQIEKDYKKVDFDTENMEWHVGEGYAGGITGFRTLSNGRAILGITSGGDWECPVYHIIYWDGTQLRGYVPTDGNPWNTQTNMAYGNDEMNDETNCQQRFGCSVEDVNIDQSKVDVDILKNI
jgi:hypothetical protein